MRQSGDGVRGAMGGRKRSEARKAGSLSLKGDVVARGKRPKPGKAHTGGPLRMGHK